MGGGNSAAADALYLSRIARKVYIVHRRNKLRAAEIYQKSISKTENIEILWDCELEKLIADDRVNGAKIKSVNTCDVTDMKCDGIFISIGREPLTGFLNGAVKTDSNGYIIADETTKTDIDGVFAAGDVRTKALRQAVTAAADGAVAAHFAERYISQAE